MEEIGYCYWKKKCQIVKPNSIFLLLTFGGVGELFPTNCPLFFLLFVRLDFFLQVKSNLFLFLFFSLFFLFFLLFSLLFSLLLLSSLSFFLSFFSFLFFSFLFFSFLFLLCSLFLVLYYCILFFSYFLFLISYSLLIPILSFPLPLLRFSAKTNNPVLFLPLAFPLLLPALFLCVSKEYHLTPQHHPFLTTHCKCCFVVFSSSFFPFSIKTRGGRSCLFGVWLFLIQCWWFLVFF